MITGCDGERFCGGVSLRRGAISSVCISSYVPGDKAIVSVYRESPTVDDCRLRRPCLRRWTTVSIVCPVCGKLTSLSNTSLKLTWSCLSRRSDILPVFTCLSIVCFVAAAAAAAAVTSTKEVRFSLCLFVCLFVCLLAELLFVCKAKTAYRIFTKFSGKVSHGPQEKPLDFVGNPSHVTLRLGYGSSYGWSSMSYAGGLLWLGSESYPAEFANFFVTVASTCCTYPWRDGQAE